MPKKRKDTDSDLHTCIECMEAYDFHCPNAYDGKPTLLRCQYYTDGRFSKVINSPACSKFHIRQ